MKKLKILSVLLVILLIALVMIQSGIQRQNRLEQQETEIPTVNATDVINNGGFVVGYDGYNYYLNTKSSNQQFQNYLCRRNVKNDDSEKLFDFEQYEANDKIWIYHNRVFYEVVGQTYSANLNKLDSEEVFCLGQLLYITEQYAISWYNGNIYLNHYYPTTYVVYKREMLVRGNCVYLGKDENNLYFYNTDSNHQMSFLKVNLNDYDVAVIGNSEFTGQTEPSLKKSCVSKHYLFLVFQLDAEKCLLVRVDKEKDGIIKQEIEDGIANCVVEKDDFYYLTEKMEIFVYSSNGKDSKAKLPSNVSHLYALKQQEQELFLYQEEEPLINLGKITGTIHDVCIAVVSQKVYIKYSVLNLDGNGKEYYFYRVNDNGIGLKKLNE